jgi:SAM-dependent methyltransferase
MVSTTESPAYTERLARLESVWWKRILPVQAPYKAHLRGLKLGFVLDIGCGLGRNLLHLNGNGVGVDHNPQSIETSRSAGLEAYLEEDFLKSKWGEGAQFDSILLSHILEHMDAASASALVRSYLPYLRSQGRVVMLCPQSAGFAADPTHVTYFDSQKLEELARTLGLTVDKKYSFPFPQWVGRFFKYNEFVVIARKA